MGWHMVKENTIGMMVLRLKAHGLTALLMVAVCSLFQIIWDTMLVIGKMGKDKLVMGFNV